MRELTKITAIGSCRISTPFKSAPQYHPVVNNTDRVYGYTHTSAEALQQIRFLQGDFTPASEILPLLMPNADVDALREVSHDPSDIYFIELSSAKILRIEDTHVQLNYVVRHFAEFFADKLRARDFWRLSDGSQESAKLEFLNQQESFLQLSDADQELLSSLTRQLATLETLTAGMVEIQRLLPRAVFITHSNATTETGPIPSRAAYIALVEEAAAQAGAQVFNPTNSMQAFGQSDAMSDATTSLSHYSQDFAEFLFDGLFDRYILPRHSAGEKVTPTKALAKAISLYRDRSPIKSISRHIGGVAFITGSLGAGGAERQMTRLAVEMKTRQTLRDPDQIGITGEIEVFVANLSPDLGKDFFLPKLQAADIPVSVISKLPADPLGDSGLPETLQSLLRFLPPQTLESVRRLTPHFAATHPEVAYIWQDGAVLSTALAALAAHVPRIVVSLRGMPPDMRPEMMKDEYFDMYRSLSVIPGVTFSANTATGARGYENWLDLPHDAIRVVHNAAESISTEGEGTDHQKWQAFVQTTPDADFTFGGVFRFDQNKRPMLWLEFAAAALVAHPCSRFILVGDGTQFNAARAYAIELGIEARCLFVGKSRNVGFWLSKMDGLGLTSRLEGLPNVLIEAQLSGVPVISTPAGGAGEAFTPNETGFLLSSTERPQIAQFLGFYLELASNPTRREVMRKTAIEFTTNAFSMEKILFENLRLLSDRPTLEIAIQQAVCA